MPSTEYDPNKIVAWTSKQDTTEPKTIFYICPAGFLANSGFNASSGRKAKRAYGLGATEWGVMEGMFDHPQAGWENFKDHKGNEIPFSKDKIECIPYGIRDEMLAFAERAVSEEAADLEDFSR